MEAAWGGAPLPIRRHGYDAHRSHQLLRTRAHGISQSVPAVNGLAPRFARPSARRFGLPAGFANLFLRVSQINGCAYCIDMHWQDLMKMEADPRHVNAVAGWREAPFFDERERAALEWAELVTAIPNSDPSDEAFARLRKQFNEEEIAELGFVIATITAWNLLNVSFRNPLPEKA
jgi:AhpD family alkylhydroperoxidase